MSTERARRPYGSWVSPIGADAVAADRVRLADLQFDGDDLYWVEGRPAEHGRCVIARHSNGASRDVLPAPYSARTLVHEYGGGAVLARDGTVYFSNMADGRLHVLEPSGEPRPLTPDLGDVRFADMAPDPARRRLVAVAEDHRGAAVVNDIRAIPLDGGDPVTLLSGNDFYSNPRVAPDGSRMAWLTWNQPNMPWDGTELWVADLDGSGMPRTPRLVAGGARESVFQPSWSPQGVLHAVSDRTGWWNLYRHGAAGAELLAPMDAECGQPGWVFGLSTYAFLGDGRIAMSVCRDGLWTVGTVPSGGGAYTPFDLPFIDVDGHVEASGDRIAVLAGGPRDPTSVVVIEAGTGSYRVLRRSSGVTLPEEVISTPEPITFPGWGDVQAHAFFYAPRNDAFEAPADELPPLLVRAHGGPTSATAAALDPLVQYWTSRGFAYVDVNYGGSSGYGRPYRERLNGQQGVVDVGDCVNAALHLAEIGRVDGERLLIEGGSAGGYIVLCGMTFHDVFAAGCSLFGISDLEALCADTHKFEARYCDSMVGPYPEARALYHDRSPIHFVERVRRPVILFQGLDDRIVPAAQAEVMYDALRDAGIPCAYIAYAGEQHGFRKSSSIVRTLEAELYFFSRILGFDIDGAMEPVEIANLEARQAT